MADVKFVLNASADIASGDEVRAAVKSGVTDILAGLPNKDQGDRLRPPASLNVNPAATGTYLLDFGSPNNGDLWWLVEVVVTVGDDRTAPVGTLAALYCGFPPIPGSAPPLGNLIRPAIAVPATFQFSGEAWPVKENENLFAVIYAPTTAVSTLSGVATVMAVDASAVSRNRT